MLWLRFTRHFAYSKLLGPKMFMVLAMIGDVAVFVALLLVVLIGYGVAVLAVQQPFRTLDLSTYIDVLLRPTFQVGGGADCSPGLYCRHWDRHVFSHNRCSLSDLVVVAWA